MLRLDFILNNKKWAFPDVHAQYTVALLAGQHTQPKNQTIKITGPSKTLKSFQTIHKLGVNASASSLGSLSIIPLVPSQTHMDVLAKMRRGIQFDALQPPELETKTPERAVLTRVFPHREIDETNQRDLFSHPKSEGRTPVWKGRCFDQYDPHGRDPAGYCVLDTVLRILQKQRISSRVFKSAFPPSTLTDPNTHPILGCRIAFGHVTNKTNSRTIVACLVPPYTPLTNAAPYLAFSGWSPLGQAYVLGVFNSIPFDWLARRYVEMNMNYFILNQLCFPLTKNVPWQRIGNLAARLSCVDDRFAKFAIDVDVECYPLDDANRNYMRAEIDALVARAYALTEDELRFVFTDFTESAVSPTYRNLVMSKFVGYGS